MQADMTARELGRLSLEESLAPLLRALLSVFPSGAPFGGRLLLRLFEGFVLNFTFETPSQSR